MWTWFWVESEKWPKYVQLYQQKVFAIHLVFWRILALQKSCGHDFEWRVKSGQNTKCIALLFAQKVRLYDFGHFWRILATQNHVDMILSGEWKSGQNRAIFSKKYRLYTFAKIGEFWPLFTLHSKWGHDFEWRVKSGQNRAIVSAKSKAIHLHVFWRILASTQNHEDMILSGQSSPKVTKIVQFWSKSKAIHLVFWRILAKNHVDWFWMKSEKWPKSCNFEQKVRLYTWYFGEFWPQIRWTWFWVESEKWPKYVQLYEQKVRLYTCTYFGEFWPKIMWTDFEWRWKVAKIRAIFSKKYSLYFWYFGEFWPKIMWTDFEWRVKSDQNHGILSKR